MLSIIHLLILFFAMLIISQFILAYSYNSVSVLEGLTTASQPVTYQYQPYDTNNPNNVLILAQQNAGNIQALKQQMDSLNSLNNEVQDISGNVAKLQSQVAQVIGAQQQYVQQVTPSTTPSITGATT